MRRSRPPGRGRRSGGYETDRWGIVKLLIGKESNRFAVRDLLEPYFDVDTEQAVDERDLYLVDDRTFPRYRDALAERVDRSDPVFCPVVLIRRRDSAINISLPRPDEREGLVLVDDVVDAPLDRGLLFRRLVTLLARRRQSQELTRYAARLEASNERLEQFAYAASHDLQEPLRMVSSYLSLVERRYADSLDDDGREFIEFAVDGADRMREMIQGLLEYSRIETEGDPFVPVDLNTIVTDVLTDLQLSIEEHDAELTVEDLPRVEGDATQLRQVFQNLLSNAMAYSGDDPPRIHVTAERRSRVGNEWVVSVSDDGIGIDPAQADRVFEVFQRLHSREEHPGAGIGLAMCQRIVERHRGEIWLEPGSDDGATFSFTLSGASDPEP